VDRRAVPVREACGIRQVRENPGAASRTPSSACSSQREQMGRHKRTRSPGAGGGRQVPASLRMESGAGRRRLRGLSSVTGSGDRSGGRWARGTPKAKARRFNRGEPLVAGEFGGWGAARVQAGAFRVIRRRRAGGLRADFAAHEGLSVGRIPGARDPRFFLFDAPANARCSSKARGRRRARPEVAGRWLASRARPG